jgi:hypothetical protein
MRSFNIKAEISGQEETLLVVPEGLRGERKYRLIKDGVEFCSMKQNGEMGWEVNGTPLNAEELDSISKQIRTQQG